MVKRIYIFEPILMVTALYFCIFIYRPIIDILNGDVLTFGVDTFEGCQRGCMVFLLSYFAFVLGYISTHSFTIPESTSLDNNYFSQLNTGKILLMSLILWLFSYLSVLLYVILQGKSLNYILSFGLIGTVNDTMYNTNMKFLTQFAYIAIIPWFLICKYSRNIIFKVVVTVLTVNLFLIRGTRIYLLAIVLVPLIYHYATKGKTPKLRAVVIILFALLLGLSIIQFTRHGIRHGDGLDSLSSYSLDLIFNVFDSDFTTYKQFYGIVSTYPSKYPYTLGQQMFVGSITQFIPRALWPDKPVEVIAIVLKNSVNEWAVKSGVAFANIGEYYFEFGILGCVFFQFLLGKIYRKTCNLYAKKGADVIDVVTYAALYTVMFNTIIRCNTCTALLALLFTIFPVWVIKLLCRRSVYYEYN